MRGKSKLFLLLGLMLAVTLATTGCALPMAADEHTHEDGADHTHDEEMPDGGFVIGVSNTLVGNGWREQMICAIKAEATASGMVDEVIVVNRNGGPTEQIADLEGLISQGVDAIILNPTDREGLNAVIEAAIAQGIVVVAVDQAVTAEGAYVATNDQNRLRPAGSRMALRDPGRVGQGRGNARH